MFNCLFYREDRQAYFSLQARCKELRDKISLLDSKCSVLMEKRFGEKVTMGDIESFAVNRTLEEMKEIARRKEQSLYKTIKTGQVIHHSQKSLIAHVPKIKLLRY